MIQTLNYLEIWLRNRIDNVIQKYFGTNWLINNLNNLILSRKDIDKINDIEQRILKIKHVRNRIAHHEPIWNNITAINEIYSMCQDLINAMSQKAGIFL